MKIARRSSYIKNSLNFENLNTIEKINIAKILIITNVRKFEALETTITNANRDILNDIFSNSIVANVKTSTIDIFFATRNA